MGFRRRPGPAAAPIEQCEHSAEDAVNYIDVTEVVHVLAGFGCRDAGRAGLPLPELSLFRRLQLSRPGAGFNLEMLERSQQEINEVTGILQG